MEHVNKELERVKCYAGGPKPVTVLVLAQYSTYIHIAGNIAGMHNSADVERRAVSGRREAQFIGATWARPMPR
jgi:hypothetical protein